VDLARLASLDHTFEHFEGTREVGTADHVGWTALHRAAQEEAACAIAPGTAHLARRAGAAEGHRGLRAEKPGRALALKRAGELTGEVFAEGVASRAGDPHWAVVHTGMAGLVGTEVGPGVADGGRTALQLVLGAGLIGTEDIARRGAGDSSRAGVGRGDAGLVFTLEHAVRRASRLLVVRAEAVALSASQVRAEHEARRAARLRRAGLQRLPARPVEALGGEVDRAILLTLQGGAEERVVHTLVIRNALGEPLRTVTLPTSAHTSLFTVHQTLERLTDIITVIVAEATIEVRVLHAGSCVRTEVRGLLLTDGRGGFDGQVLIMPIVQTYLDAVLPRPGQGIAHIIGTILIVRNESRDRVISDHCEVLASEGHIEEVTACG